MHQLRIGCHGVNGHQILGVSATLKHAAVTALSGVSKAQCGDLKKQHPHLAKALQWVPSLEVLLRDPDVDMISICSPRRDEQADDIIRSLEAGKHVYAEKPLALTLEDLRHIREAVARSGKALRAMTGASYVPAFVAMKEIVDSGQIGSVVQVCAQKSYPYHDERPQDRGVDGGLITQAGIHAISFIRWVTGLDFLTVSAFDTSVGNPGKGRLQMAAAMSFSLNNGAVGVVNCNYLNPQKFGWWGDDRLRVYGTEGMVESFRGGTRVRLATHQQEHREMPVPEEIPGAHLAAFIDLLTTETPMRVSAADSLVETEVVIAAQLSADRGGMPISLSQKGFA
ncbi:MAG: Gfo/Idh/MocA family oxidoreductase [Candidatus Latescibacterota bacterium]